MLGTLGVMLRGSMSLARGLVPVRQAEGSVGPLHGAGVDVCGSAVDGCGTGLARPHSTDGALQACARRT